MSLELQEDLCIMQHINGKLVFTSAAVYFPMRWFFMEKVGREMDGIHSPVPFYQEDLKRPVDNFMAKGLKAGKPFQRSNWMVSDNPDLNQVGTAFYSRQSGTCFRVPLSQKGARCH